MKKVVILSNHHAYTYNFRKEIIQELIDNDYEVTVVLPYGEKVEDLKEMGCKYIDLPLDRRGMNPLTDLKLLANYYKIIKRIKPVAVLSYTIKPNIYGGMVCRRFKIPFFPNVTGLGTAVEQESFSQKILVNLYKIAFKEASCVFFQNEDNHNFFKEKNIKLKRSQIIPGSGINLEEFTLLPYPEDATISFVFISRIMKEKGIDQYLNAAKHIKNKYPNTKFHICGFYVDDYEKQFQELEQKNIIIYHGMVSDVREIIKETHCTIHPTYYPEGMSNVLLESAASGRPIITTDRSGCKEVINDGVNGYVVKQQDSEDLIGKIKKFLELSYEEKRKMGLSGREKVTGEFDRQIVVDEYLTKIENAIT